MDSRRQVVRKMGWIRDLRVALRAVREANMTELFASTSSVLELLVCSLRPEIWRKGRVKRWLEVLERTNQRREMTDERNCCWHV